MAQKSKLIENIKKANLFYRVVYAWDNSTYSDILHFTEIYVPKETNALILEVIPIKGTEPQTAIKGAKAKELIKLLTEYNEPKTKA